MDHPTCHLYVSFPDIQTLPQACLHTEKIQMRIKLHSEGPIYRTDFNIQRAPWRVFEHSS